MPTKLKPDLFTFVAGVAVERNEPLPITCNCGGRVANIFLRQVVWGGASFRLCSIKGCGF